MVTTTLCLTIFVASFLLASSNPFVGHPFYVNPSYVSQLDSSIETATGKVKETLESMRNISSAYWIDVMSKLTGTSTNTLEGILADAASYDTPPLVVLIVYDLPNRDCHAKASNGEICCYSNADGTCDYNKQGDCKEGLEIYSSKYIDPFAEILSRFHTKVPIVVIIEPDSLPNLATNLDDPRCSNPATMNAYRTGVTYAVNSIASKAPEVSIYVDAAHGGWLGWKDNTNKFVQEIKSLDIMSKIRGFATNVANYQPIGIMCPSVDWCLNNAHPSDPCCSDPCKLLTQWNPGNNEMNYVQSLSTAMNAAGMSPAPYFIVDSGRNGVPGPRQDCGNWCNIRGAGVGVLPTTETASPLVDAYHWLKTPGESDGCTQILPNGKNCPRFDSMCASVDSIGSRPSEPRAPEAGHWFDYQIKQLAENANFGKVH